MDSIIIPHEEFDARELPLLVEKDRAAGQWVSPEIRKIRLDAWNETGANLLDDFTAEITLKNWQKTPENKALFELCARYVEKFDVMLQQNWGLFFYGETGTGKSYAAICIANALLDKGREVLVTSPMRLLGYLQDKDADAAAMAKRISRADLLVLDDLGAERDTSFAMEQVYNLIDARYRARKPMVVTSNESSDRLKNEANLRKNRIFNRVVGCCRCVLVKGKDYRAEKSRSIAEQMKKTLGV